MSDYAQPTKLEIIQHEVGHWIAAKELGFTAGEIEINVVRSTSGIEAWGYSNVRLFFPALSHEAAHDLIKKRAICLAAGVCAQILEQELSDWEQIQPLFDSNGRNDFEKIKEYLYILANLKSDPPINSQNEQDIITRELREVWSDTSSLVENNKSRILHLSKTISGSIIKPGRKVFPYDKLIQILNSFDSLYKQTSQP